MLEETAEQTGKKTGDISAYKELKQIVDRIIAAEKDDDGLKELVEKLYTLFSDTSGIHQRSELPEDNNFIILESGKALAPKDAGTCILDHKRTTQFIKGTIEAIKKAKQQFRGECINVIYAGCGPFAPFAFAAATQFSPEELKFTLLEIHKRSVDSVKNLIEKLQMQKFIRDVIQCDAVKYKHTNEYPLHILVAESMQKALSTEPQVSIFANLIPQLVKGGLCIPEKVIVEAVIGNPNVLFRLNSIEDDKKGGVPQTDKFEFLGKIFELSKSVILKLVKQSDSPVQSEKPILPVSIFIPAQKNVYAYLMLFTRVIIFESVTLERFESGITVPLVYDKLGPFKASTFLEISYFIGTKPEFRYRTIDKNKHFLRFKSLLKYLFN